MGKGAGESTLSSQHAHYQASSRDIFAHIKTVEDARKAEPCTAPVEQPQLAASIYLYGQGFSSVEVEGIPSYDASYDALDNLLSLDGFRSDSPPLPEVTYEASSPLAAEKSEDTTEGLALPWAPQPGFNILDEPLLASILFPLSAPASPGLPAAPEALLPYPITPDPLAAILADAKPYTPEPVPVPQDLATQEAVLQHLPFIQTSRDLEDGTQVTFTPTLWRRPQAPFGAMINVRVTTMAAARPEEQVTSFYGAISPRIVTTGVPARHHPYVRPAAGSSHNLRGASRSHSDASAALASAGSCALARQPSGAARTSSGDFILEEMWLLKRNAIAGVEVLDSYHFKGPFESSAVPNTPAWPGAWKIDLVARISDADGASFWLKALQRDIQAHQGT